MGIAADMIVPFIPFYQMKFVDAKVDGAARNLDFCNLTTFLLSNPCDRSLDETCLPSSLPLPRSRWYKSSALLAMLVISTFDTNLHAVEELFGIDNDGLGNGELDARVDLIFR